MMSIRAAERALNRDCLKAPGGFVWWYLDLLDVAGDGLVLIWSFGLPFLPGYAHASRRGRGQPAGSRPSLNVAVYRGGKLDCYLLQEYDLSAVKWEPDEGHWRFGRTRISSRLKAGRRVVEVDLDCPVPAGSPRLRGTVRLAGAAPRLGFGLDCGLDCGATYRDSDDAHDWTPLAAPARGSARLSCGKTRYEIDGRAYHDCNVGKRPLHEIGIGHWLWGRSAFDGAERVYFALWPRDAADFSGADRSVFDAARCFGMEFFEDGRVEYLDELDIMPLEQRRSLGGIVWWRRFELFRPGDSAPWVSVQQKSVVDSGPFYMRHITRSRRPGGGSGPGFAELIRPSRIDLTRHRLLVDMRVHRVREDENGGDKCREEKGRKYARSNNSLWLPLFSGPRRGRVGRLAQNAALSAFDGIMAAARRWMPAGRTGNRNP
jgi:hypothetical protein